MTSQFFKWKNPIAEMRVYRISPFSKSNNTQLSAQTKQLKTNICYGPILFLFQAGLILL